MKEWKYRFRRILLKFFILLRRIKLPGFQGMGLYDVLKFFFNGLSDSKFTLMAAAMSYHFFFSLFFIVLLIILILPHFPIEQFQQRVMDFIVLMVPEEKGLEFITESVDGYLSRRQGPFLIIFSFLMALWGGSRGIIAMMKAFTKDEVVFKKRNVFELYSMALIIFAVLGSLIIVGVSVLIAGDFVFQYLSSHAWIGSGFTAVLTKGLEYLITLLIIFLAISTLYYLAPATHQRWKFISPGGIAAGILTLAAMIGLKYFFSNFFDLENAIYGSLATIILLMIWYYYISIVLLVGFEINAAIDLANLHKGPRKAEEQKKETLLVGEPG